jgi:fatty acid desaturase
MSLDRLVALPVHKPTSKETEPSRAHKLVVGALMAITLVGGPVLAFWAWFWIGVITAFGWGKTPPPSECAPEVPVVGCLPRTPL